MLFNIFEVLILLSCLLPEVGCNEKDKNSHNMHSAMSFIASAGIVSHLISAFFYIVYESK